MLKALQAFNALIRGTVSNLLDTATVEAKRHKALAEHHKLMYEVRSLIKSLGKVSSF